MARVEEHRKPDGNIDWDALRAAEIAEGSICQQCGHFILRKTGRPTFCQSCTDLNTSTDEVTHDKYIRCPVCRCRHRPYDCEMYDLLEEGDHEVSCPTCDCDFTVNTVVSYDFTSPPVEGESDAD